MVRLRRGSVLGLAALGVMVAVAACGSDGSKASEGSSTSSSTASSSTTTTSVPSGGGVTEWVDVTTTWKTLAPTAFAVAPEQVAEELAALAGGGDTSEVGEVEVLAVVRGEPLHITLRETGIPDDAVSQIDTEITLEGSDEGWVVSDARQQRTCSRGVDENDARLCV